MKLNAKTKKVQNINVLRTDQTAIYSNFKAAMATRCILDRLRDRVRCCMCEYDYDYEHTMNTTYLVRSKACDWDLPI